MNFLEAVKEMKDGKKIRRKHWTKGIYLYAEGKTGNGAILNQDGDVQGFCYNTINDDWLLAEEDEND